MGVCRLWWLPRASPGYRPSPARRWKGVGVGEDGCDGCRALPMGTGPVSGYGVTFLRRHDGKGGGGVGGG